MLRIWDAMRLFLVVLLVGLKINAVAQFAPDMLKPAARSPVAPLQPAPAVSAPLPVGPQSVTAPGSHSISFEVKIGRAGGATDLKQNSAANLETGCSAMSATSLERVKQGQLVLDVILRNFASRPDQATVEWVFFAEEVDENSTRDAFPQRGEQKKDPLRILSEGSQGVTFKPGGTEALTVESAKTILRETRSTQVSGGGMNASHKATKAGHKIVGWLVRTRADGKVLGIKASGPKFEALARNEVAVASIPRLNAEAMIAPLQSQRSF